VVDVGERSKRRSTNCWLKIWRDECWILTAQQPEAAALIAAERRRKGRPVDMRNAQIAGIVVTRRAKLATRNVKHFADLNAEVVNPWGS